MKILILFLNNEIRTGGHRRLLELAEALAERGNEVSLVLNRDLAWTAAHAREVRIQCAYVRGAGSISRAYVRAVKDAVGILGPRVETADLIHIHGESHLRAALWLKARYHKPVSYAHRSNMVRESLVSLAEKGKNPVQKAGDLMRLVRYRMYEVQLGRSADQLLFQSSYDADDFAGRNGGAASRSRVIPGNIGLPRFQPSYRAANTSGSLQNLVFVGTLGERKGLRYLMEAFRMLHKKGYTGLKLDVLGPGDQEYWKRWLEVEGLGHAVTIHGRVANPFDFLKQADLLVVPSNFDSFPDTVLEGFHVGIPVIGSWAGGIPEMIGDDRYLFPVQDAKACARVIEGLMDTEAYARAREHSAARRLVYEFDWAERWELAFRELLS